MIILHEENDNRGSFYVEQDGDRLAEMDYRMERGKMIIDHTEVDESLRGQNVGFLLVENGVEYARENNIKILPLCSYAKSVINRTERFQDVL